MDVLGRPLDDASTSAATSLLQSTSLTYVKQSFLAVSQEATDRLNDIYTAVLGRPIDPLGTTVWQGQLGISSLTSVRSSISHSAEATADVQAAYLNVLGRAASASDVQYIEDADLAVGSSLANVDAALAISPEATDRLNDIYIAALGRPIDALGTTVWQGQLGISSLTSVRSAISYSPEAQADINQIVVDYTGVNATSDGLASMSGSIAAGASLANIANWFANQPAAQTLPNYVPGAGPDPYQLAALPITPDDAVNIVSNEAMIVDTALAIASAWTLSGEGRGVSPQDTGKTLHARFAGAIRALSLPGV